MAAPNPDANSDPPKPIHSLVLDTGPLIKNDPPVSVLLAKAEALFTIPSVLAEIRDQATRSRVETTLRPFLTVRTPRAESVRFVQGFARKTGDLSVLSRPDLDVLALAFELECERNGGDWRLRSVPGQRGLNGRPGLSVKCGGDSAGDDGEGASEGVVGDVANEACVREGSDDPRSRKSLETRMQRLSLDAGNDTTMGSEAGVLDRQAQDEMDKPAASEKMVEASETPDDLQKKTARETASEERHNQQDDPPQDPTAEDSDSDSGWITASNIKTHQAADNTTTPPKPPPKPCKPQY
ncbi:D-site 20S pre-rRNA nuclease [Ophiocordyceps camponoti-floridani]|uniref:D-site 20S pre-rRNA nuclease n=1 Tax=Ophiocordyceps camponoti-floridani TaxID=2030778 RepID=A0A8H4QEZ9_9HYPO|nr:D-site 20S pre-rRNA nuclease [Ophiocordyceps camponoti-floridani]